MWIVLINEKKNCIVISLNCLKARQYFKYIKSLYYKQKKQHLYINQIKKICYWHLLEQHFDYDKLVQ